MEKIKNFFGNCKFFSKKTLMAGYYGMLTWAAVIIVLGLPKLATYQDAIIIAAMVIMAASVEVKSGGFNLFEFIFDLGVGAVGCVLSGKLLKLKFMIALSKFFNIPLMRVLIVLCIVAMFCQTQISFKPEKK